jgi:hypothetical protein
MLKPLLITLTIVATFAVGFYTERYLTRPIVIIVPVPYAVEHRAPIT